MFSSSGLGSFNNDVLQAQPVGDESKLKLIEEIKSRAKGCLAAKNYPEAVALYSKAIEVCPEGQNPAKAILYANRSMCRLAMSLGAGAVEDAQTATELDPAYVKGYYRLGMAHLQGGALGAAKEAFTAGLDRKRDDKDLLQQLAAVEQKLKDKPSAATTASSSSFSAPPRTPSVAPASTSSSAPRPPAPSTSSAEPLEDEDQAHAGMRGYRRTADGKLTTFFNHELDEQTKALIGDIAPRKLEQSSAEAVPVLSTANGGSVWNSAGTYEERILSPWACDYLSTSLGALSAEEVLDNGEAVTITSSGVEGLVGDAQVTMVRGKRKHLADFSCTVRWVLRTSEGVLEGGLPIADISADGEWELGEPAVDKLDGTPIERRSLNASLQDTLRQLVQGTKRGLQPMVVRALGDFCRELKTK